MASSVGHQSPQSTLPPLQYKTVNTQQWLTTGNTDTVTDPYVCANSIIVIMNTSARAGNWYVSSISAGSFTVTSSDAETASTTTYSYIVL